MVECFFKAHEDVLAITRLLQVKLRAAAHHLTAMLDELLENALERHCLRHTINQHNHIEMEGILKRSVFVEEVQHLLWVCTLLEFNHYTDVASRLVAQTTDTVDLFIAHEVGDADDHVGFVHAVRNRGDNNLKVALFPLDDLCITPHHYSTAAGRVCM